MGQIRFCCKIMLWPWPLKKRPKCCARYVISIWWSCLWNSCKIWLPITKSWTGHGFTARSCCDLDLQGINPNVVRNTSSPYGDHFCKIVLKSNFKNQFMGRTRYCCKVMLRPWPSRWRPKSWTQHVVSIWRSFLLNSFKIRLQITKL